MFEGMATAGRTPPLNEEAKKSNPPSGPNWGR